MLVIAGTAGQAHRDTARTFITALGTHESNVADMVADAQVRLTLVIDAPPVNVQAADSDEESDELDAKTVLTWRNATTTTLIDIAVPMLPGDQGQGLVATLLHELVLHAEPGYVQHRHAVALHRPPGYPTTETAIENAEAEEHGDVTAWVRMVGLAEAVGGQQLKGLAVFDAGQHGVGARVLEMLVIQGSVTDTQAAQYLTTIQANGGQ